MRAIVQNGYGPPEVLQLLDVARPAVGPDDVLVQVHAASVNPTDWHYLTGSPPLVRLVAGLARPRQQIRGVDVAGRVETVGANVTRLRVGDEVFGLGRGAFAEYVCAAEDRLVPKPANVSFEQAAAVPIAGLTALQALGAKGRCKPGNSVLINGASGGVGTLAVQIATSLGADVTGVCSTRNVDMVRSLGAGHVVDYTRDDFAAAGPVHDLLLDLVGNRSLAACRRTLRPDGTYVLVGGPSERWARPLARLVGMVVVSPFVGHRLVPMLTRQRHHDLVILADLLAAGDVSPVIDRRHGLHDVANALRRQAEGHASGKTVIVVDDAG